MSSHAVIIGGSMAGMCAARVLADRFDRVTVLDKDRYPARVEHRVGVPQSHHAHALLARGQRELERLFPGFERAMTDAGATLLDFAESFAILRSWGWAPRSRSGLAVLWASRPLLESVVRGRLRRVSNVELREGVTVERLCIERADGGQRPRVSGVAVAAPKEGEPALVAADLVVDASGRGTKVPKWLQAEGVAPPEEETVDAFAGYASRFYRRPPKEATPASWWWDGLWIEGVPPDFPRGGVAFPVEDHRWLVTAVGFCKDYPPTDEAGFVRFLESLNSPILARTVEKCEPLSDIVANRSTTNRFRHYERWNAELDGFLAVGDGVCSFNPVYGQGMSTAAACAAELEGALRDVGPSPRALPRAHFRRQARFLKSVWGLAAGADFVWPMTQGSRPVAAKILQRYLVAMVESAHCDPAVQRKLVRIFHLLDHPSSVVAPSSIAMVLKSTLRRRLAARSLGAPTHPRGSLPPELAEVVL